MIETTLIALTTLLAGTAHAQDVAPGQKVFNQFRSCHQVGETAKNELGPALNGLRDEKQVADPVAFLKQ